MAERSQAAGAFGIRDAIVSVAMVLLWGLNIVTVKIALTGLGPITTATMRLLAILLLCLPWLRPMPGRTATLVLLGLDYGFIFALVSLSLSLTDNIGALAIASQLSVPIAVILGMVLLGERPSRLRLLGIFLAFGGVCVMVFDPGIADDLLGLTLMTVNAAALAVASLLQRRLANVPVPTILAWSGFMGSLLLVPLCLSVEPEGLIRVQHLAPHVAGALGFTILGSTLIAPGCMAWLLQRHDVSIVMPLSLASTLVTITAAYVFLGAVVTPVMAAGGAISLAGLILVMRGAAGRPAGKDTAYA